MKTLLLFITIFVMSHCLHDTPQSKWTPTKEWEKIEFTDFYGKKRALYERPLRGTTIRNEFFSDNISHHLVLEDRKRVVVTERDDSMHNSITFKNSFHSVFEFDRFVINPPGFETETITLHNRNKYYDFNSDGVIDAWLQVALTDQKAFIIADKEIIEVVVTRSIFSIGRDNVIGAEAINKDFYFFKNGSWKKHQ